MDIRHRLYGVEFEWNERKATANVHKHGITFAEATKVFFDPFYQEGDASVHDEERAFILEYSLAQRILLVVYVDRQNRHRIIIPLDTLESIREVAAQRDMSEQALLKFYIGQGLREDLARLFGDRIFDTTAEVLTRYIPSKEQVTAIMREIREETYG